MQDSTNTRDLDKKFVQTPRTQPGYVGKFSIFIVVLIFLFTFQNVNNKIKTTTENLPTQAGCVPGIPTDFLSKSLVFVESCTILRVDTSYLIHNNSNKVCRIQFFSRFHLRQKKERKSTFLISLENSNLEVELVRFWWRGEGQLPQGG